MADWLLHSSCFILRQDTTSNSLMCEWVNKAWCIKVLSAQVKKYYIRLSPFTTGTSIGFKGRLEHIQVKASVTQV